MQIDPPDIWIISENKKSTVVKALYSDYYKPGIGLTKLSIDFYAVIISLCGRIACANMKETTCIYWHAQMHV